MNRAQGRPIWIDAGGERIPLERIYLGNGTHNENWLQALIHDHPEILPIADIEPGFGTLIPAAREVPCGHGLIDNLYLTPAGEIVLVETKLWRNNEIRREVVAQALDYVAALTAMSFEEFERSVARGQNAPQTLFALVADDPEALGEAQFIDAIASNLRRGRLLVMVLGDGIRSETELLGDLLQSHAGAHFTFALVEVATFQDAAGGILAVPCTLARTVMIERGIVRIEGAGICVEPPSPQASARAQSISMNDFMSRMAERDPRLPAAINALIDALEPLGIYPDLKASLNFKADVPQLDRSANFGYIDKRGQFWTNPAALNMPEHIWRPYFAALALLIGGQLIDEPGNRFVAISGRSAPRIENILPAHHEALVAAIETAIKALHQEKA